MAKSRSPSSTLYFFLPVSKYFIRIQIANKKKNDTVVLIRELHDILTATGWTHAMIPATYAVNLSAILFAIRKTR